MAVVCAALGSADVPTTLTPAGFARGVGVAMANSVTGCNAAEDR